MAAPPASLKQVNSFLKLAKEYDKRDATVAYFYRVMEKSHINNGQIENDDQDSLYSQNISKEGNMESRMYAVQKGIKIDSKSKEAKQFLFGLMDQLESVKKDLAARGEEAVSNDIVAQAHIESVVLQVFNWADREDRNGVFNKNVTKAFYSSSLLFEVLTQFGELNEECTVQQKYAKWKATYLHRCAQTGETPLPGPEGSGFEEGLSLLPTDSGQSEASNMPGYPPNTNQPNPGYPINPYPPGMPGYPPVTQPPTQPRSQPPSQPTTQPIPKPRQPVKPPPATEPENLNTDTDLDPGNMIDYAHAEKLCKFAISALQYEDVTAAVDNLTKALALLKK